MTSKRLKILSTAEKIFAKKGAAGATISEIARKAGVSDAIIYQHFKGKEDLLFSIPAERLRELVDNVEEALQGINHVESCLRKFFWSHLNFFKKHKDAAKIFILQCRPSDQFYVTPGYEISKQYESILQRILQYGIEEGSFRKDISMSLVTDLIIGMLDFETLGMAVTGETKDPEDDLDDMMAIINAIIRTDNVAEQQNSTEEKIILAAEKIFRSKGFIKATMSEIASVAGVAEGTVYDYFANKDQLMLAIPTKRMEKYYHQIQELFIVTRPIAKMERYLQFIFNFFLKAHEISKVFYQILMSQQFYASDGYKTFQYHFGLLENIVTEGIQSGDFRPDVNARIFRNMFMGICTRFAVSWFNLEEKADQIKLLNLATELLIASISTKPGSRYSY